MRHWSQALETRVRLVGFSFAWVARRLEEACVDMNCDGQVQAVKGLYVTAEQRSVFWCPRSERGMLASESLNCPHNVDPRNMCSLLYVCLRPEKRLVILSLEYTDSVSAELD